MLLQKVVVSYFNVLLHNIYVEVDANQTKLPYNVRGQWIIGSLFFCLQKALRNWRNVCISVQAVLLGFGII
jgi:hypothetical protein